MSYQQVILVGNLGRDPELKYTPAGDALCKFSVAVSEKWRNKANEQQEKTVWFSVTVWGNQAETCAQYLAKGSQAMIIGTVEARAYMGKDGNPAVSLDLKARDVRFLSRTSERPETNGYDSNSGMYDGPGDSSTDIPF
jgi:single-strand DNA-binding protein